MYVYVYVYVCVCVCVCVNMKNAQPVGQKRFTNVAAVRYRPSSHSKLRFEVACYKNTVEAYRSGAERDLDDVLQSTTVFTNLSKGIVASEKELQENFGTSDLEDVCKIILARGVLQVGGKERERDYETLWRDVANILAEKCINPDTKRPYTSGVLQKAMKDTGASLDLRRPAKV